MAKSFDELKQEIEEISHKYTEAPESKVEIPKPETSYKTYDAPTDAELDAQARANLSEYASASRDSIQANAQERTSGLMQQKTAAQQSHAQNEQEIAAYYDDARKRSSDSALKRGLARSSIAQLSQDALNESEAQARSQARGALSDKLASLDAEITRAEQERTQALRELDVAYAVKLTQELNSLKADRDRTAQEVTEYNNELALRLADFAQESVQRAQAIEKAELELASKRTGLASKGSDVAQQEIFDTVSRYLAGLSPSKAMAELETNSYYRGVLSPLNYNLLYNVYASRFDWGDR